MVLFKSLRKGRKSSFSSEASIALSESPNGAKAQRVGHSEDDAASVRTRPASTIGSPRKDRTGMGSLRGIISTPIQEDGPADGTAPGPISPTLGAISDRKKNGFFGRSGSRKELTLPQRSLSYGPITSAPAAPSGEADLPAQSPAYEAAHQFSSPSTTFAEATADAANQPPGGARPSDLFAGKGLAWGDLSLSPSGTAVAKAPQQSEDLTNFLKARRQWVPTFVTGEKEQVDVKPVSKPDDITFSALPSAGNVMSLSDLDASHKRKQQLLDNDFDTTALVGASDLPVMSATPPLLGPSATRSTRRVSALLGSPLTMSTSNQSKSSARKAVPSPISDAFAQDRVRGPAASESSDATAIGPNGPGERGPAGASDAKHNLISSNGTEAAQAPDLPTDSSAAPQATSPAPSVSIPVHNDTKLVQDAGEEEAAGSQEVVMSAGAATEEFTTPTTSAPVSGPNGGFPSDPVLNGGGDYGATEQESQPSDATDTAKPTVAAVGEGDPSVAEDAAAEHPSSNMAEASASVPQEV